MTLYKMMILAILFVLVAVLARIIVHASRDIRSIADASRSGRTAVTPDAVTYTRLQLRRARLASAGMWVLACGVLWVVSDGGRTLTSGSSSAGWVIGVWGLAVVFAILSGSVVGDARRYHRQVALSLDSDGGGDSE